MTSGSSLLGSFDWHWSGSKGQTHQMKFINGLNDSAWIWIGNHKNVTSLKWSNVTYSWTGNFKSLGIRISNHLVKFLNAYNSTNHSQEPNVLKYRLFNSHASSWHTMVKMTTNHFLSVKLPRFPSKKLPEIVVFGIKIPPQSVRVWKFSTRNCLLLKLFNFILF